MNNTIKTIGLTVKSSDYKDNDKILTLLSKEYGQINFGVRGCKKNCSPLLALSSNLCFGEFVLSVSKNQKYYLKDFEISHIFYNLSSDIEVFGVSMFICNVSLKISNDIEDNSYVLSLVINLLYLLESGRITSKNALGCFCIKICDVFGVRPNIYSCTKCGKKSGKFAFNIENGGIVCHECYENDEIFKIKFNQLHIIDSVIRSKNIELDSIEQIDDEIILLLIKYIKTHLFLENRFFEFLKKIKMI